jgi:hypothetical protein
MTTRAHFTFRVDRWDQDTSPPTERATGLPLCLRPTRAGRYGPARRRWPAWAMWCSATPARWGLRELCLEEDWFSLRLRPIAGLAHVQEPGGRGGEAGGGGRLGTVIGTMADTNPAQAIDLVVRINGMCTFLEHPAIKAALEQNVPRPLPPAPGAFGFEVPLWVGLGMVGLWAALDGFRERAGLHGPKCGTCGRKSCIRKRFEDYIQGNDEGRSFEELEDLRHLYAHNYAGEADDEYFRCKKRHVLIRGAVVPLTCGAQFTGRGVQLDLPHLRMYSRTVQDVLERAQGRRSA